MQGRRVLSFFSTKKAPVPPGEDEGRMIPAANESFMYWSIASLLGAEREHMHPLGGDVPGNKSKAQSWQRGDFGLAKDLVLVVINGWYPSDVWSRNRAWWC